MLSEFQKTSDRAGGKHGSGCCSCSDSHAFIILGVSEYMRLVITAAGIKDAMESAVVSVVNDNYNEVYHGVREGYAAGYEPDDTGFAASVDHGDIYGRMCFLLGLEEDGNSYVRYNNSGELEYRLKIFLWTSTTRHWHRREELIMRMQRSRWKCLCVSQEKSCRICRSG